jgi:hypothetical protein
VATIGVTDLSVAGASGVDFEGEIERKKANNEAPQKPHAKPFWPRISDHERFPHR